MRSPTLSLATSYIIAQRPQLSNSEAAEAPFSTAQAMRMEGQARTAHKPSLKKKKKKQLPPAGEHGPRPAQEHGPRPAQSSLTVSCSGSLAQPFAQSTGAGLQG